MDDRSDKIEQLAFAAAEIFDVQTEKGLTLLTIRHYNEAVLEKMTEGKTILLKQQNQDIIQILMK